MPACGHSRLGPIQSKYRFALSCPKRQNFLVLKENRGHCPLGLHMKGAGQGQLTVVPENKKEPSKITQVKSSRGSKELDHSRGHSCGDLDPVWPFVNLFATVLEFILLAGHLIFHVVLFMPMVSK